MNAPITPAALEHLSQLARAQLPAGALGWLESALAQTHAPTSLEFGQRLSGASRQAKALEIKGTPDDWRQAALICPGWQLSAWNQRDLLRALLVLNLPQLEGALAKTCIDEAFQFADEGELVALYQVLPLLPLPERFLWRAGEGCRSNMQSVFRAIACHGPYPALYFDEPSFKQTLLKAVFVGAPLTQIHGVDGRLSLDLARMALDFSEERASAGRPVPVELWLLLGPHAGQRGERALEALTRSPLPSERVAGYLGLLRAGRRAQCETALHQEQDSGALHACRERCFDALEPRPPGTIWPPYTRFAGLSEWDSVHSPN